MRRSKTFDRSTIRLEVSLPRVMHPGIAEPGFAHILIGHLDIWKAAHMIRWFTAKPPCVTVACHNIDVEEYMDPIEMAREDTPTCIRCLRAIEGPLQAKEIRP